MPAHALFVVALEVGAIAMVEHHVKVVSKDIIGIRVKGTDKLVCTDQQFFMNGFGNAASFAAVFPIKR